MLLARGGGMRRPIYGQHNVDGNGDDRAFAHGLQQRSCDGSAEGSDLLRLRQGGDGCSARGSEAARHPHARGIRERIASVAATGGSTNAVLHLLAIAREAGVPLDIDDFQTVSERTPLLADLKPSGRFVAADMHRAGGIRLLAQKLLRGKHLHRRPKLSLARRFPQKQRVPSRLRDRK